MVASWGLVDDFDDDVVTTSTSGCGFAALQRCLRIDEMSQMSQMSQMGPDGTRWDQGPAMAAMGPGKDDPTSASLQKDRII